MILREDPTTTYKFIKEDSEVISDISPLPGERVEISLTGEPDLENVLEAFERFLIASGFHLAENESIGIIREIETRDPENESDTEI
jgi:hypothetical protein